MLSVIIPAYNERLMIEKAARTISDLLNKSSIEHELIFIDDGSRDLSWEIIQKLSERNSDIRGIHFSRNFGKEAAIMAGLAECVGDCSVVIDCDLQHPPEKIVEMYHLWQKGYEIVEGRKISRGKEGMLHKFSAKTFYALISKMAGIDMMNASDFKLLDRRVVDVLIHMNERNVFFRALSSWVGFRTAVVEFDVMEREAGESKWSPASLIRYALNNISSFSAAPMQIVTFLGGIMFLVSLILGVISLAQKISGQALEGFTTVIIIQLFSSSIIMVSLGIIGFYIARIYEEVKCRPRYIIKSQCGGRTDDRID